MSLSKYPNQLDMFQTKTDAQFDGDPNGDFVMADDVNALQDAVSAIETSLGVNPQGNKLSVGERITLLEGSSALRVPSFLIYLGNPSKVNNSDTTLEAAMWFAKFDHIVLGNNAMDPNDPDHASTLEVINYIRTSKDVKFYGYIDCGVNTFNLSISEIQNQIIQWRSLDVAGIYCANFGYEDRVSRDRQNQILDSIHQYGLVAVLDGVDPEQLFTNIYHETMNPNWIEPNIKDGDIYHYSQYALDSSRTPIYEPNPLGTIQKLIKLYDYRVNKGIKVFATSTIQTNVDAITAQQMYDYAHTVSIVTSMDAFYPVTEGYAELTNYVPVYNWMPIAGNWYMSSPRIEYDLNTGVAVREVPFGKITLDFSLHTYKYEGLYIPYEMLKIAANSIDGSLLKDGTVEDIKIKNYDGQRLIGAINNDVSTDTIDIKKIATFNYTDIDGQVPVDVLKTNIIEAINAYVGTLKVDQAFIGNLDASKITTGTLNAGQITASVVEALNLYAETMTADSAKIGEAVIGNLSAEKITAGNISAERLQAAVVEAINLSAKQADIQNLNADNITAGNVKAERIQANVVNAINAYVQNMVVGSAVINSAAIGELTAGHIRASVIEAVNGRADTMTINSAKIAQLTASHIEAAVIEAINANIDKATIKQGVIEDLSATKITTGTLDADIIKGSVITAINFNTETAKIGEAIIDDLHAEKITAGSLKAEVMQTNVIHAINGDFDSLTINQAKIGDLDATKITAGNISADRLQANIVAAVNAYAQNMTADSAKINSGAIGVLSADHMQAKVISAINASIETINGTNAVIDNAKIGALTADHIKATVLEAIDASVENIKINQAKIGDLDAEKITAGNLKAEVMQTNVIHAINGDFENATIQAAKIGELTAGHITATVIEAINGHINSATIDGAKIGTLEVDSMAANVIYAINGHLESATIDAAKIGELEVNNLKVAVINAINASVENIKINNGMIDNLTADHIKAVVIDAINGRFGSATIDAAKIGVLEAGNIKAGSISSDHIAATGLKAEQITSGFISAQRINTDTIKANMIAANQIQTQHMQAGSIKGDRIEAGTISGDRLIAGTLDASFIKAGTITSELIAAGGITARNIATGSITADMIQAGSITAEKISTKGLDAQVIQVYNGKTGEVLIGSGYLRVDGLDVGVVQSDNLVANGAFMTSSSAYGYLRDNPTGEAILGGKSEAPGAHQLWKISLADGTVFPIDLGAKKPVDFAIDTDGTFGYVTMQGNDTLVQVDLANNTRTGVTLPMGKGPGRLYFNGDTLMDSKHFMVLSTDPEDVNIPDSLLVVDAPPTSIDQALYVHHVIPLGNKPYDVVTTNHHMTYVTLADQGDIAVLAMTHPNSMNWKPIRNIPISAYMTDNYHGGMPGSVGLNEVTGGDSASQYDTMTDDMDTGAHVHGGYGVTDGTLLRYEPHGLSLSTDPETLYVADYANGYLIIVDTEGKAPYNALTGSRQQGNLGVNGIPMNMGPNKPENPPTTGEPTGYVPPDSMTGMSIQEVQFEAMMSGTTDPTIVTDGGRSFSSDQTTHVTNFVRYRIPVGDSPEFVKLANGYIFITVEGTGKVAFIKEQDILDKITWDRWYYTNYDEFTEMAPLPNFTVGYINVGSKPSHMHFDTATNRLYVTVNGQNQVVIIDTTTIDPANPDASIVQRVNVGANPKGIAVDKNGQYMYVVNHGGTGNLSFVYPDNGSYIGDPYVGLEGGVEYQGADQWVPMRSNWVANVDGDIVAGSTVEFHINEPFLNEGGYAKLTAYNDGNNAQYAYIEQDIVNVVNYSNGNNTRHITGEVLRANDTLTMFTPEYPWLQDPGVTNVKIMGITKNETLVRQADNLTFVAANKWLSTPQPPTFIKVLADGTQLMVDESTYTITYPTTDAGVAKVVFNSQVEAGANIVTTDYYWWKTATGYTVEYTNGAYIQFNLGVITEGQWVVADYTHRYNLWFKPHNGSMAVAAEQGSTDNFYTKFEIDEFVPKFVTYDNQHTEPFVYSPIVNQGTNANYDGIEYSMMTNRALGTTVTSSVAPVLGSLTSIVDGLEPSDTAEENGGQMHVMHSMGEEVQFPSGLQSVTIDLGKTYMIGHVVVMHSFHKRRKYHATKTQVSEDGVSWTTVYDSAVSGEYMEYSEDASGYRMYGNHIKFYARPVRYIRDYANGYTEYTQDPTTLEWTVATEYVDNYWTEIKAYGDWEFDTSYVNADGTNMATNGRGIVSTDITGAYASIDISIDFTSKWYITYLIGPEFGMADVEMSSMMGMTHALTQDSPVLSKFQHKHIMYWPPSSNVKDDPMMNVKAGKHRATIRQRSGRINIDRFRFEDYQYFGRNSQIITPDKSATFRRTKIVPTLAQWYSGDTIQSSEGAYDAPRLNPDTGQPDYSVSIKYRMRFRVDLSQGATLPDGSKKPGRGIAYATSAIFETGKLSSHWRMSSAADFIPGTRIESWDGNHPHKTGIQHFHLANGAVKGNKIYPLSIMDHHINPYAKIQESKLKLSHPTHRHGQPIMAEVMPGMMMEVGFAPNNSTLDSITGWGDSGTSTNMARADHLHDDRYVLKDANGSLTGLDVQGNITVTGTVDGVDVSQLKSDFDTHTGNADIHFSVTERTKLSGVATGATKVASSTNGKIKINDVDTTVYTHPTGDGNLHVPVTSTTNNGKFLKAGSTAGSLSWAQIAFTDVSGTITATQHGSQTSGTLHAAVTQTVNGFMSYADKIRLDGMSDGANKTTASSTNGYVLIDGVDTKVYTHPTGDGNLHVPANGTSHQNHVLKASATAGTYSWAAVLWNEISGTFSDTNHGSLSGGTLHAVASQTVNGFMSFDDKKKLDGIQSGAINQTTADNRYLQLTGGTLTGILNIKTAGTNSGIEIGKTDAIETPFIDFHSSGTTNDYDVRLIASGGTSGTNGKGKLTAYSDTFDVQGNITLAGTVDGVDVASFKSNYDSHTKVPNAPTSLVLTENDTVMNVKFTLSSTTEVTEYEVWASFGNTTSYEIVGIVNKADIAGGATTYTFVDDSYNRKGTIYYRVYAKNGSVRSIALEGNATIVGTVADPTNLQVVANIDSFDIFYTVPNDRRLAYVEVVVDKQAVEANLAEANGVVVYSGLADRYTYKIPSVDYDKFHNVWVRSVTRT